MRPLRNAANVGAILTLAVFLVPLHRIAAQDKTPDLPKDELTETLGKVTLTLDAGGHTHDVKKVVFTPDNKHLISGSGDGSIRIWDVETGKTERVLYPPERRQWHALFALSPNGKQLAVIAFGNDGSAIYLMSVADGHIEGVLRGHSGGVGCLAYSSDGKQLASFGTEKAVHVWDVNERKSIKEFKTSAAIMSLSFAPDGSKLLQFQANQRCSLLDLASGNTTLLPAAAPVKNNWPSFDKAAWSPDGKLLAAGGEDGVRIWHADLKLTSRMISLGWVHSVAFSSDSRRIIATVHNYDNAGGPKAVIIDVKTSKPVAQLPLVGLFPWTSVLSPNGELAATGIGGDRPSIIVWKTQNGARWKTLAARNWLVGADIKAGWSGNGKAVFWRNLKDAAAWKGGATGFNFFDLEFGPPRAKKMVHGTDQQGALALRTKGDDTVLVLKNGKVQTELKLPGKRKEPRDLTLIGPNRAALCCSSYGFFLYDTNTGKLVNPQMSHPGWVRSLAPSPDNRFILSLSEDQTVRLWNAKDGEMLLTLYVSGSDWIAWTPKGYYAATPGGERLMGWRTHNGPNKETEFFPADRFRKFLYRPDVIKLVLEKGSVAEAIAAADAARGTETRSVKVEEMLPPRAVLTVADDSKLPTVRLKVQAEASVKNQPITSLRLLMDGRPVQGKAALHEFKEGKLKAEVDFTFEIPEGEHQLAVLVRSEDSSGVSKPVRIKHVEAKKLPTLYVLTVGVNEYKDSSLDLKFAVADAEALAAGFGKNCKDAFSAIKTRTLLNKQATSAAILREIKDMRKLASQQDLVIVFFACHGVKQKSQYFLLTHEASLDDLASSALSGAKLKDALGDFKCQVLLMLDACHSAGFGTGKKLTQMGLKPATDDVTRDLTEDDYAVAVMCAAMSHEKAEGRDGHGLFTRGILDALEKKPGVPYNPFNQRIYVHHLQAYVFDHVSHHSEERQHPCLNMPWIVESFVVR